MQPLYVELSDEITTVIGRMKEAEEASVALVVPKGAILLQSVVNLKLAKRAAKEAGKELTLITTDKIGRNLCKQVGISAFSRLNDQNMPEPDEAEGDDDNHVINGVKVHRYYDDDAEAEEPEKNVAEAKDKKEDEPAPIVVPKEITKEKAKEPEDTPIKVRPVANPEAAEKPKKAAEPSKAPAAETKPEPVSEPAVATDTAPDKTEGDKEKEAETTIDAVPAAAAATIIEAELPLKKTPDAKAKGAKTVRKRHPAVLLAYLAIVLALGGAAAGAYYLPRTVVTVTVKATAWTETADLVAKAGTDIPAQIMTGQATGTATIKATATKDIGAKATGTATLYNTLGSDVTIPAGSVITANGQGFTTDTATTVPAITYKAAPNGAPVGTPGSANVSVTAQAAGPAGNMSGVSGTVAGSNAYARIVSTAGGTSQVVNVISQKDIDDAKATLTAQLRTDSTAKLAEQMKGADYLYDESKDAFAISDFKSSLAAGAQGDSATATANASLTRLVADKAAFIASAQAQARTARTAADSTLFVDGTDLASPVIDVAAGTVSVSASTRGRLSPTINAAALKDSLASKKLADGVTLVKEAAKGNAYVVQQTPSWWPLHNFPLSKQFLTVTVTYE